MPQSYRQSRGSVVIVSRETMQRITAMPNIQIGSDALLVEASAPQTAELLQQVKERAAEIVAEKAQG